MVRTKADSGPSSAGARKTIGASTPKMQRVRDAGSSSTSPTSAGKSKYAGGNPVVVRPKPDWQRGISLFMSKPSSSSTEVDANTASGGSSPTSSEENTPAASNCVDSSSSQEQNVDVTSE